MLKSEMENKIVERFKYAFVFMYKYENRYGINGRRPKGSKGICKKAWIENVYGIHNLDKERSGV